MSANIINDFNQYNSMCVHACSYMLCMYVHVTTKCMHLHSYSYMCMHVATCSQYIGTPVTSSSYNSYMFCTYTTTLYMSTLYLWYIYISRVKIKRNAIKIIENAPPSIGASSDAVKKYTHMIVTHSYTCTRIYTDTDTNTHTDKRVHTGTHMMCICIHVVM